MHQNIKDKLIIRLTGAKQHAYNFYRGNRRQFHANVAAVGVAVWHSRFHVQAVYLIVLSH